jgi:biopolymer transport protein ExbD
MAIEIRNKRKVEFNMASFSDLVFLLLIFFMLTSTLVAPNAVKLLLPSSNSKTMAKPAKITVYIDPQYNYYVDGKKINKSAMEGELSQALRNEVEASVVLRAEKTVAVQHIVNVIDAVNNVNKRYDAKHKVILATKPKGR